MEQYMSLLKLENKTSDVVMYRGLRPETIDLHIFNDLKDLNQQRFQKRLEHLLFVKRFNLFSIPFKNIHLTLNVRSDQYGDISFRARTYYTKIGIGKVDVNKIETA